PGSGSQALPGNRLLRGSASRGGASQAATFPGRAWERELQNWKAIHIHDDRVPLRGRSPQLAYVFRQRLDGLFQVARLEFVNHCPVLAGDVHRVGVTLVALAEVLANAGHHRLPDGQDVRLAGALDDRGVQGDVALGRVGEVSMLAREFHAAKDFLEAPEV